MAEHSLFSTSFWNSDYVRGLHPQTRFFYSYLISSPEKNLSGVYKTSYANFQDRGGWSREQVHQHFRTLSRDGRAFWFDEQWVIINNIPEHHDWEPRDNRWMGVARDFLKAPRHVQLFALNNCYMWDYIRFMCPRKKAGDDTKRLPSAQELAEQIVAEGLPPRGRIAVLPSYERPFDGQVDSSDQDDGPDEDHSDPIDSPAKGSEALGTPSEDSEGVGSPSKQLTKDNLTQSNKIISHKAGKGFAELHEAYLQAFASPMPPGDHDMARLLVQRYSVEVVIAELRGTVARKKKIKNPVRYVFSYMNAPDWEPAQSEYRARASPNRFPERETEIDPVMLAAAQGASREKLEELLDESGRD